MNNRILKILTVLCALVLTCGMSVAAPVVKARMDSAVLLMGKLSNIEVQVDEPANVKGHFVLFSKLPESGFVSVCGDSVELRMPTKIDTVKNGNSRKLIFTVPVQAFDSGAYLLPSLEYVAGPDTARSNRIAFKVVPVKAEANDPIADYAGTADPEDPSFFDWVPQWVLDFWWLILIVIAAIVAMVYAMRRYRKEGSLLPRKPQPTPYEEAMSRLRELKEKKLWEQGMDKEYFTELTDILRTYLYRRFNINAMEMTSRQILHSLSANEETKDKRAYFRKILDMADFVKFAKVRPLPDDNIASYENAVRFVKETKPVPVEDESDGKKSASAGDKKGERPAKVKSEKKGGKK